MENRKIKNYFNKISNSSKIILVNILADNLVYLHDFEIISQRNIKSISSILLLLIDYKSKEKIKEFDEFSAYEKKILFSILIDGIASIKVDNEYLKYSNIENKEKIIHELLSFFKYITKFSKEKVFEIYKREIKKYKKNGFCWNNPNYNKKIIM